MSRFGDLLGGTSEPVVDTAPASMDPPEATAEQPPEEETKDETDS